MDLVTGILLLLGVGFLVANAKLAFDYVRFLTPPARRAADLARRRSRRTTRSRLGLGVALGLLVFAKLVVLRRQAFGETMMFLYYAYFLPLSLTIGRGFYEDGIWADTAFIPYNEVGGISWREGEHQVTLIVISRLRNLARRLTCRATSTARRGACCATRSASTRSISPAPASTSARTTSGTRRSAGRSGRQVGR